MPQSVSKRQYRMMQAILHAKKIDPGSRGRPPRYVAEKYTPPPEGAPESVNNDKGGSWDNKSQKKNKKVKKTDSVTQLVNIVMLSAKDGKVLLCSREDGAICIPTLDLGKGEQLSDAVIIEKVSEMVGKDARGDLSYIGIHGSKFEQQCMLPDYIGQPVHSVLVVCVVKEKPKSSLSTKEKDTHWGAISPDMQLVPHSKRLKEILGDIKNSLLVENNELKDIKQKSYESFLQAINSGSIEAWLSSLSNMFVVKKSNKYACMSNKTDVFSLSNKLSKTKKHIDDMSALLIKTFVLSRYPKHHLGYLLLEETLAKNIIRSQDIVMEATHGDSLKLVGTGLFRFLKESVKDLKDEDFTTIKLDVYTIHIRKHMNDVYSGRVEEGNKNIFHWRNKSLPELTVALMSVFEWYLPEDEEILKEITSSSVEDEKIESEMKRLVDEYHKNNISNIYQEMENIRKEIRNGVAVDLREIEQRMMNVFDSLKEEVERVKAAKQSEDTQTAQERAKNEESKRELQEAISMLKDQVKELKDKLSQLEDQDNPKQEKVEAISFARVNPIKVHDESYMYLPRPKVEISPSGKITIVFDSEWTDLEKENFLHDLKARVIKRSKIDG